MGELQGTSSTQRAEFLLRIDLRIPYRQRPARIRSRSSPFTLANGFTFVEAYLARRMKIDDFVRTCRFFFSYGMEPEYAVLGRVARRIWAVRCGTSTARTSAARTQFHSQTSGRSLHAQEIAFNDIRTRPGADIDLRQSNSCHQRYDERSPRPTRSRCAAPRRSSSVINKEWGLGKNENPNQGSFIVEELTDPVEEAVLRSSKRSPNAGRASGAWRRLPARQDPGRSMVYDTKARRLLSIVGVNTFATPAESWFSESSSSSARPRRKAISAQAPGRVSRAKQG